MTKRNPDTPFKGSVSHRLSLLVDRTAGPESCWPHLGRPHRGGYRVMQVEKVTKQAHVWAFLNAGGNLTMDRPFVLHHCDNPPCCNPRHLRAGSAKENSADRDTRGRAAIVTGTANPAAKLTPADIADIRGRNGQRGFIVAMAAEFGVTHSTISNNIRRGKVWNHVP